MADPIDHQAGFIGMEDRFLGQDFHQPLLKGFQGLILLLAGALQRGFTDRIAEHFGAHFPDPPTGPFLGVVEVGQQGAEVLAILDGSLDVGGKGRHHGALAARTHLDLGPMLRTFQLQRRQVEDLAALIIHRPLRRKVFPARTLPQGMDLDVLGRVATLERAAGVTGLPPRLATRLFAEALGLGLLHSVGGRGP